jgi:S-adenosylmethionine hydrolase
MMAPMIATFTDFGVSGPYLGQVRAALSALAPGVAIVDIFPDLPAFDIQAAACLIPAYSQYLPDSSVCLCVVDPGVGGPRKVLAMRADQRWYVGPDNGLLSQVARRASRLQVHEITWRPARLSNSFHGRDLFAPICARLASGQGLPTATAISMAEIDRDWPDDFWRVVYVDSYGNCITGVRASSVRDIATLRIDGLCCQRARTFSDVSPGTLFWYENSNGLVEIAMSAGNAAAHHAISVGGRLFPGGE